MRTEKLSVVGSLVSGNMPYLYVSSTLWFENAALFQVFVGARLHVTGGVLRGGRSVEGDAVIAGDLLMLFLVVDWKMLQVLGLVPLRISWCCCCSVWSIGYRRGSLAWQKWSGHCTGKQSTEWSWSFSGDYASMSPCSCICRFPNICSWWSERRWSLPLDISYFLGCMPFSYLE